MKINVTFTVLVFSSGSVTALVFRRLSKILRPSRTARTAEGTEILTYEYTKTVDSNFSFFIFFDADDRREERTIHIFEIEDGIVTKHWKE